MDASVGGKIIKLTIESAFSLGVLANCIYESVREWRVRGYSRGGGGGVVFLGYCGQGWALVWGRSHLRFFELGRLLEEIRYL